MLLASAKTLGKVKYFVYVLACRGNRYYVGFSRNLHARLKKHFVGEGAIFTYYNQPLRVIDYFQADSEVQEFETWKKYVRKYGLSRVGGYSPFVCEQLGFAWPFERSADESHHSRLGGISSTKWPRRSYAQTSKIATAIAQ